jgi:hypothetical protein
VRATGTEVGSVPEGLAPLDIDSEADVGTYWEPNVRMVHPDLKQNRKRVTADSHSVNVPFGRSATQPEPPVRGQLLLARAE